MQTCAQCPHLPSKKLSHTEVVRLISIGQKVALTRTTLTSEEFNFALNEAGLLFRMLVTRPTEPEDFNDAAMCYVEQGLFPNSALMTVALYEFPHNHQGAKTYMAVTYGEDMPYVNLAKGYSAILRSFELEIIGKNSVYPPYRNQTLYQGDRVLIMPVGDPSLDTCEVLAI